MLLSGGTRFFAPRFRPVVCRVELQPFSDGAAECGIDNQLPVGDTVKRHQPELFRIDIVDFVGTYAAREKKRKRCSESEPGKDCPMNRAFHAYTKHLS